MPVTYWLKQFPFEPLVIDFNPWRLNLITLAVFIVLCWRYVGFKLTIIFIKVTIYLPFNFKDLLLNFEPTYIKQSLDEVFVISGIIKVEVSVISRAEGRGW